MKCEKFNWEQNRFDFDANMSQTDCIKMPFHNWHPSALQHLAIGMF